MKILVDYHNHLPLGNRSDRANLHTIAAAQAMRLFDAKWNAVCADAVLRAYPHTASAADAGVRDEEAFLLFLSAAEGEGSPVAAPLKKAPMSAAPEPPLINFPLPEDRACLPADPRE